MIVDKIENGLSYELGESWGKVISFLENLNADSDEGKYEIQGEDIYARVSTIDTLNPADSVLEAHRNYADVQVVLDGVERLDWFPIEGLDTKEAYDEKRDVVFFVPDQSAKAQIEMHPGNFVLLYPQDAHMPMLMAGDDSQKVKKVVVKVKAELLS